MPRLVVHPRNLAPLLALVLAACAGNGSPAAVSGAAADETAGVVEAQRAWWRAYAAADTTYLQAHTTPAFSLTVGSGATFDRAGMLAQAATHVSGSRLAMSFTEETARLAAPCGVPGTCASATG